MRLKYHEFKVYKDIKECIGIVFQITRSFDSDYFSLKDQINRSAISMALNVAEGSAKSSDKDFNRYVLNSLGSATELSAALDIAHDLKLIESNKHMMIQDKIDEIIKQLGGFSKYLKKKLVIGD